MIAVEAELDINRIFSGITTPEIRAHMEATVLQRSADLVAGLELWVERKVTASSIRAIDAYALDISISAITSLQRTAEGPVVKALQNREVDRSLRQVMHATRNGLVAGYLVARSVSES